MKIIDKLATSLGRRDEAPNIALAEEIVKKKSYTAITELITLLRHSDRNIQSDSIKVLYEIGERNPTLIEEYDKVFLSLLDQKNNRLVWGAMAALDSIIPYQA